MKGVRKDALLILLLRSKQVFGTPQFEHITMSGILLDTPNARRR